MKRFKLYLSVASVIVLVGGWKLYSLHIAHQKELQQLEIKKYEHNQEIKKKKDAEDKFTQTLKEFVETLTQRVNDYNKQMIVVKESVKPFNFEKTEFASENYTVISKEIIPMIHKSADSVMSTFEEFDKTIKKHLQTAPPDLAAQLETEWAKLRKEQMENYIAHFTHQEKIVRAHQELLKFYAKNFLYFEYNADTDTLDFDEPEMASQEKVLKDKILSLRKISTRTAP